MPHTGGSATRLTVLAAACALSAPGAGCPCVLVDAEHSAAFVTLPRLPELQYQRSAGSQALRGWFGTPAREELAAEEPCERGRPGPSSGELVKGRPPSQVAAAKYLYVPGDVGARSLADLSRRIDSPSRRRSSRTPSPAVSAHARSSRSPSPASLFVPPSGLGRRHYAPFFTPASSVYSSDAASSYLPPRSPSTNPSASASASSLTWSRSSSPCSRHAGPGRPSLARGSSATPSAADVFFVIEEEAAAPSLETQCRSGGSRGGRGAVFLLPPYEAGEDRANAGREEADSERTGAARRGLRRLKGLVMPYRERR